MLQRFKSSFKLWLASKTEDCRTIVPLFSYARDRHLTLLERVRVKIHLFTCLACLHYVSNLKFMHEVFEAQEDQLKNEQAHVSLSPEAAERIKSALKSRI